MPTRDDSGETMGQRQSVDGPEDGTLVHRQTVQLILLVTVAVAAFFVTRAIAASNRAMELRDAAEWFRRGQEQMANGTAGDAIVSFRRATARNRREKRYVLALASALAHERQYDAARSALLALRESSSEDPDVNLQLARLSAARQDVSEAVRYYHDTLYAPWPPDRGEARRQLRFELIDFMLSHHQTREALAELVGLSTDMPEEAALHVQVGRRFAAAGDNRNALEQFEAALRIDSREGEALAGAGVAAFALGEYPMARRYLRRAPPDIDDVAVTREVVDLVVTNDPLASRIGSRERLRRLHDALSYGGERLASCIQPPGAGAPPPADAGDLLVLGEQARSFDAQLQGSTVSEQDTIEDGVSLLGRLEAALVRRCPPATARDRALILIAQAHEADEP